MTKYTVTSKGKDRKSSRTLGRLYGEGSLDEEILCAIRDEGPLSPAEFRDLREYARGWKDEIEAVFASLADGRYIEAVKRK